MTTSACGRYWTETHPVLAGWRWFVMAWDDDTKTTRLATEQAHKTEAKAIAEMEELCQRT